MLNIGQADNRSTPSDHFHLKLACEPFDTPYAYFYTPSILGCHAVLAVGGFPFNDVSIFSSGHQEVNGL